MDISLPLSFTDPNVNCPLFHAKLRAVASRRLIPIALWVLPWVLLLAIAWHDYTSWTQRTTNIKSGESDYPILNPDPKIHFIFAALIPKELSPNFFAVYTTTKGRSSQRQRTREGYDYRLPANDQHFMEHPTPLDCHYAVRTGNSTEYSITLHEYFVKIPLQLKLQGPAPDKEGSSPHRQRFSVLVAADRFSPGHCQWHLERVVLNSLDGDVTLMTHDAINSLDEAAFALTSPVHCIRWPASRDAPSHDTCKDLGRDWLGLPSTASEKDRAATFDLIDDNNVVSFSSRFVY